MACAEAVVRVYRSDVQAATTAARVRMRAMESLGRVPGCWCVVFGLRAA